MPRLLLLRHAKSSWEDSEISDFARPLNTRGRRAAPQMGRHCAQHNLLPQQILCSSSRRTRETLAGLLPYFAEDFSVQFTHDLYMSAAERHIELLRKEGGASRTVMMIGHNPAMQDLAVSLIGSGNPALRDEITLKFPTAALAVIDIDGRAWADLAPGQGRIVAFFRPRELFMVDGDPGDGDD